VTIPPFGVTRRGPVLCAALCAILFAILAVLVTTGQLTPIDTRGILAIRAYASPLTTRVMLIASAIAHGRIAVPVALATALALYAMRRRSDTLLYVIACVSGEVLMLVLKELVHHHRPIGISPKLTDAGWFSFPSGHVMLAVIIFGLGAVMLTSSSARAVRAVAVTLAALFVILVALSRVYLGAHWPSDVVGAGLAGLAWSAALWAYRRCPPRGEKEARESGVGGSGGK
jgi:undecaprenyl-diphosphatase